MFKLGWIIIFNIVFLNYLFCQYDSSHSLDSLSPKSEYSKYGWKWGLGINNGISILERQSRNNGLNSIKTVSTSPGIYNQIKLLAINEGEIGFHRISISHRVYSNGSDAYDTDDKGDLKKIPSVYRYYSLSLSYDYNFYFKWKGYSLFAGMGLELSYYYNRLIKVYTHKGLKEVNNPVSKINNNYHISNNPTLYAELGIRFALFGLEGFKSSISFKKDLHYFISSSIPIFNTYGINLDYIF